VQIQKTLGDEDARIAIEAIRIELVRRGKSAVIAVVDAHGETIGLLRMNGSALSSVDVAINKAFTAARLRRPAEPSGATSAIPKLESIFPITAIPAMSAGAAACP
jgi:glc operon protein GlcG